MPVWFGILLKVLTSIRVLSVFLYSKQGCPLAPLCDYPTYKKRRDRKITPFLTVLRPPAIKTRLFFFSPVCILLFDFRPDSLHFLFVNGSFDGFYYLDDNNGCQRKACCNDEFVEPEICRKAEYFGDGINEDYDAGQKERKDERAPEVLIPTLESEIAAIVSQNRGLRGIRGLDAEGPCPAAIRGCEAADNSSIVVKRAYKYYAPIAHKGGR